MPKFLVSLLAEDLQAIDVAACMAGETRSAFLVRAARAEALRAARPIDDPRLRRAYMPLAPEGRGARAAVHPGGAGGARPGPSLTLVVDASVAFKWLIPDTAEPDVGAAKAILTFCDAVYVVLADALDCGLVTAHQRLLRRVGAAADVRLRGD